MPLRHLASVVRAAPEACSVWEAGVRLLANDAWARRVPEHARFVGEAGDLTGITGERLAWRAADMPEDRRIVFAMPADAVSESRRFERLELAVHGTHDGIWDWDLRNGSMWFSPRWKQILGYEDHELTNESETWRRLILDEDRTDAWRLADDFNSGRVPEYLATHRYRHKNGTIRHLLSRATHVLGPEGELLRMVGAVTDVTDLIEARRAAETASRAKGTFLANMSHEIRTPMNGVLGLAQLLARSPLEPFQQDWVRAITASAESLLAILNDVLDLAKVEAGTLRLDPRPFSLAAFERDLAALYGPLAEAKAVRLVSTLDAEHDRVFADPSRLRQIVSNLLGNAVKFTHAGEVTLEIVQRGGRLTLSVSDSGVGIPADRLARVWDPFVQADDTSQREYGGAGLGLSIVRVLTERMGGVYRAESEVGRGSRFEVEVPARPADPERDEAPGPGLARTTTVLLAEDNAVNVMVAEGMLASIGCRVVVARDGEEAVRRFDSETFGLVLMDLHMPNLDGFGAMEAIRRLPGGARVPIVALTAAVMPEDRERARLAGADGFLGKPFRLSELREALAEALARG